MRKMLQQLMNAHPVKRWILLLWIIVFLGGVITSIFIVSSLGIEKTILFFTNAINGEVSYKTVIIYLLFYVFRNIFFIPITLLIGISSIIFGVFWGIILAGIGEIIGAIIGFFVARYLGREFFQSVENHTVELIDRTIESHPFLTIAALRIIPIFPFDIINFSAGLSRIHFRDFLIGTAFFVWPDTILYVLIGNSFTNPKTLFYVFITLIIIGMIFWYFKTHPHFKDFFLKPVKKGIKKVKDFREKRQKRKKIKTMK